MTRVHKHEKIQKRVEEIILSGKLKPGDKLPPERELQEKYGIGRGTVREALRGLQQRGLIEIKQGARGGAFVKEVDSEYVSETLAMIIRHGQIPMKHLADFREVLETATAAYAAQRATGSDIKLLKAQLEEGAALLTSGKRHLDRFYKWELSMHRELARVSRNPIFEWISGTLYISMEPLSFYLNKNQDSHSRLLTDWKDIIESMENNEVMRVISLIRVHITRYKRLVEKYDGALPV